MVSRPLEGRIEGEMHILNAASLFVEAVVLPKRNSSQPWGGVGCMYTIKKGTDCLIG